MCNHLYNNLCKIAVVTLLLGMHYPVSANETSDENFGITVSRTPEPGWNPNTEAPAKKKTVWLIFLTAGCILTISGVAFLKIKKEKAKTIDISDAPEPEVKPNPAQQPQVASPAPLPEFQKPVHHSTPALPPEIKPTYQPAPAVQPENKPEPPPVAKVVAPIVEIHQPAPVVQPEMEPEPPPVVKVVEPKPNEEDDDMLFKHLDLLRHLKNESEK